MLLDPTGDRQAIRHARSTPWVLGDRALWLLWAMGVAAVLLLTTVIWQRNQIVSLGYETERLSLAHDRAVQENRMLQVEVSSLNAVERIGQIAERQIGMRPARADERAYVVRPVRDAAPSRQTTGFSEEGK